MHEDRAVEGGDGGGDIEGSRLNLITEAITAKLRAQNEQLLEKQSTAFQEKVLEALMVVLNDNDVIGKLSKRAAADGSAGGDSAGKTRTRSPKARGSSKSSPKSAPRSAPKPKARTKQKAKRPVKKKEERFEGYHPFKSSNWKNGGSKSQRDKTDVLAETRQRMPRSLSASASKHRKSVSASSPPTRHQLSALSATKRRGSASAIRRSAGDSAGSTRQNMATTLPPLERPKLEYTPLSATTVMTSDKLEVDDEAAGLLSETTKMLKSMGIEISAHSEVDVTSKSKRAGADGELDDTSSSPPSRSPGRRRRTDTQSRRGGGVSSSTKSLSLHQHRNKKKQEALAAAKERKRRQLAMIGDLELPKQAEMGQLPESEWENEIAKSILSIYHANLRKKLEDEAEEERKEAQRLADEESARLKAEARLQNSKKKGKSKRKKSPPPPPPSSAARNGQSNLNSTFKANTASTGHLAGAKDGIVHGKANMAQPGRGPAYGGKVLRRYTRPMIWFGGSGKVKAVWCALVVETLEEPTLPTVSTENDQQNKKTVEMGSGCGMTFCNELTKLEKKGKYHKYIALVESKLRAEIFRLGPSMVFDRLWRQLVVCCVVFGYKCCESGAFNDALKLLRHAQAVIEKEDAILTIFGTAEYEEMRRELFAYLYDVFSFYYLKRSKFATAIQYAKKALGCHRTMGQPHQIAKCKLHIACAQSKARDHKAALKTLGGVLKMVDDGRLESTGTSAEKICLVVRILFAMSPTNCVHAKHVGRHFL